MKEKENYFLVVEVDMKANLKIMFLKEKEYIIGMMEIDMKEILKKV